MELASSINSTVCKRTDEYSTEYVFGVSTREDFCRLDGTIRVCSHVIANYTKTYDSADECECAEISVEFPVFVTEQGARDAYRAFFDRISDIRVRQPQQLTGIESPIGTAMRIVPQGTRGGISKGMTLQSMRVAVCCNSESQGSAMYGSSSCMQQFITRCVNAGTAYLQSLSAGSGISIKSIDIDWGRPMYAEHSFHSECDIMRPLSVTDSESYIAAGVHVCQFPSSARGDGIICSVEMALPGGAQIPKTININGREYITGEFDGFHPDGYTHYVRTPEVHDMLVQDVHLKPTCLGDNDYVHAVFALFRDFVECLSAHMQPPTKQADK